MNLLDLMRESRAKISPHWVIASLICVLYGLLVGVPSGLNTYGELLSFLLAGPLQLGIAIYFLNILLYLYETLVGPRGVHLVN